MAHKIRFLLTSFAVVIGVGFVVGTIVLTDSVRSQFNQLFVDINKGIDLQVRGVDQFDQGAFGQTPPISDSILPEVDDGARRQGGRRQRRWHQGAGHRHRRQAGRARPAARRCRSPGSPTRRTRRSSCCDGGPPASQRRRRPRRRHRREGRQGTSATPVTIITPIGPQDYKVSGVFKFGESNALSGATLAAFTLRGGAAHQQPRGQAAEHRRLGRRHGRGRPGAAGDPGDPAGRRRGRSGVDGRVRQPGRPEPDHRHLRQRAARLRRRDAVRVGVPDQQHVHDRGRAAGQGAGPAAGHRGQPVPDRRIGARRGADRRHPGLDPRVRHRHPHRARAQRDPRPRPASDRAAPASSSRRARSSPPSSSASWSPCSRRSARRGSRRRCRRSPPCATASPSRACRCTPASSAGSPWRCSAGSAITWALFGNPDTVPLLIGMIGGALLVFLGRGAAQPVGGRADRPRARLPLPTVQDVRAPGRGERGPQPSAHRVDRVRADDRPGAGHHRARRRHVAEGHVQLHDRSRRSPPTGTSCRSRSSGSTPPSPRRSRTCPSCRPWPRCARARCRWTAPPSRSAPSTSAQLTKVFDLGLSSGAGRLRARGA